MTGRRTEPPAGDGAARRARPLRRGRAGQDGVAATEEAPPGPPAAPPQTGAPPDPLAVLRALGLPPPSALRPAEGGFDTLVWRVERGAAVYALRLFRPRDDARCRREAAAMAAAAAGGLPVPAVRAVGSWEGRPAMLMDWCPGHTLVHEIFARPRGARRVGRLFGQAQARLHRLPAPPELNAGWLDAGGPPAARIRAALAALPARTDALVHFDFHPLNVLTDGERISGVIDWANAGAGDPRAGLARTITILRLDARRPGLLPPPVSAGLAAFDRGWREGYAREVGRVDVAALPLFYAWAGAAMQRDLAGKRDAEFFRRVRAWTGRWQARWEAARR